MPEENMKRTTLVIAAASLLAAAIPAVGAVPLALYEFGDSSNPDDHNNYSSTDADLGSTASNLVRGPGYGTGTTAQWPNLNSATSYNTTAGQWRLYRKSQTSYVEPDGDDGNYLNDYQRAYAAGTNYLEWTITPADGFALNLSSFKFDAYTINNRNLYYYLSSSLSGDNYATIIGAVDSVVSTAVGREISLAGAEFQNITGPVTFRLWTWGNQSGSSGSAWQLDNFTILGESVPTTVPEPASATALVGMAAMGLLRRRRP